MASVTIGGQPVAIEEFSARKTLRVPKLVAAAGSAWSEIVDSWYTERGRFEAKHHEVLDRNAARARYGPEPLMDPILDAAGEPVRDGNGHPLFEPRRDEAGEFEMGPDPLGHLTEEDWQAMGQQLRLPRTPGFWDLFVLVFPIALDKAEREVLQLLALCVVSNDDFAQAAKVDSGRLESGEGITDLLDRRGDEILDTAKGQELMHLALTAFEVIQRQFGDEIEGMAEQIKNVRGLAGSLFGRPGSTPATDPSAIPPTPTTSSTSEPTSSTDSAEPTEEAGTPSAPSIEHPPESSPVSSPA